MPKYEWIEMSDAFSISAKLIDKYPNQFGDIVLNRIKFIGIIDAKSPKPGAKIWNFISIQTPVNELFETDIVCLIHFDSWSSMEDKSRGLICASILSCLEFKERLSVKGYDLHDSKNMVINFGVDYESNPDSPDILNNNYNWRNI